MGGDLLDTPNMPDWAVGLDLARDSTGREYIHDEVSGNTYRVRMYHAIHEACGYRLKALVNRTQYQRLDRGDLVSHLVYCPRCLVRVGKKGRKRLEAWGRLTAFRDIRDLSNSLLRMKFVEAYYLFPLGLALDNEHRIISVSQSQVEIVEKDDLRVRIDNKIAAVAVASWRGEGNRASAGTTSLAERLADGAGVERPVDRDIPEPEWEEPSEPPENDF
jgi:hypothetical protein